MDHTIRQLQEMLREMGVKFSHDATHEALKALLHKENHRRWMGLTRPDRTRAPERSRRVIRRRKSDTRPSPGVDTRPPQRTERKRLRVESEKVSMPRAGRKSISPRSHRPALKRRVAVTGKRRIAPGRRITVPERDVLKSVMRRAGNCCELCEGAHGPDRLAPFYLTPLDQGGTETVKNIVVLCPECLAKMQASDMSHEYILLKRNARSRIPFIIEYHRR